MKKLDFNVISFLVLALMLLFAAKADAQYWKNDKLFFNKNKNHAGKMASLFIAQYAKCIKADILVRCLGERIL